MRMTTRCFAPHPLLAPFIRTYFIVQGDMPLCETPQRVTPKGESALFFVFGQPAKVSWLPVANVRYLFNSTITQPLIVGQSDIHAFWNWEGHVNLVVVALHGSGLYHFCREGIGHLRNTVLDFDQANQPPAFSELQERLWSVWDAPKAVALIEKYLLLHFTPMIQYPLACDVRPVAEWINQREGRVSIGKVAEKFRVTTRRIEQQFACQIGLSPKNYARIVRFRRLMWYCHVHPKVDWMDLVVRFDYTDQSHLIKDFQRYMGVPPNIFGLDKSLFDSMAYRHAFPKD